MSFFLFSFVINLLDLAVFCYYLSAFQKQGIQKQTGFVRRAVGIILVVVLAAVWAWVNSRKHPAMNLLALLVALVLLSLLFPEKIFQKTVKISIFIGIGILAEPIGLLLLHGFRYKVPESGMVSYYFVTMAGELVRCSLIYFICQANRIKSIHLNGLPRRIVVAMVVVFVLAVVNCCSVILLFLEASSLKSLVICASTMVSIILTYYFILYMAEEFTRFLQKHHEEELYQEEIYYQKMYYDEMEKRNQAVQVLKHDLKNRLSGLYYLLEQEETSQIREQVRKIAEELEAVDRKCYSVNPVVDSVLRMKTGMAKKAGIFMEISVVIPKEMQMDTGDIGILYGNLLDNAIEACQQVKNGHRYIQLENKYMDGNLILVVKNSKNSEKNPDLHTTKEDASSHGWGISSVRKVVEKYNGTVCFSDQGESFEAAAMLYGVNIQE